MQPCIFYSTFYRKWNQMWIWEWEQDTQNVLLLRFVFIAISIKVVHEQSGKVEYEHERLLGIANKLMNFQSGSQQPFALVFDFSSLLVDNLNWNSCIYCMIHTCKLLLHACVQLKNNIHHNWEGRKAAPHWEPETHLTRFSMQRKDSLKYT
jgi:hypothetical protein